MADAINLALGKLAKSTPRLNASIDAAADTVRRVELLLTDKLGVGVPAYVGINVSENSDAGTYAGYVRVGSKFRISHVIADEDGTDIEVRPWTDCPRDQKLAVFEKIPELIEHLSARVETAANKAERSVASVNEALKTFAM